MARRRISTSKEKWKRKVWYEIVTPAHFGEKVIGETPASDASLLKGRTVEVIVSQLTGNIRQSHMKLIFEITGAVGTKAKTRVKRYEILRSYLRSIVRRRRRRIDDVVDVKTSDGYLVRIKPVIITAGKCHTTQAKEIRKIARNYLLEVVPKLSFNELVDKILNYEIQSEIEAKAKKIYPIQNSEIRRLEVLEFPHEVEGAANPENSGEGNEEQSNKESE